MFSALYYGFAVGVLGGARDMVLGILNIFNLEPDQNTLVNSARFFSLTPGLQTYYIYDAISNADWSDSASWGKAAFTAGTVVTPFVGPELMGSEVADIGALGEATDATSIEAKFGGAAGPGESSDVNPFGGKTNCAGCSIATEYRLRGYGEVQALDHGVASTDVVAYWVGGEWEYDQTPSSIMRSIGGAGDGGKGVVFASRGSGPNDIGHFFNVVNRDGVVQFLDFQRAGDPAMNLFADVYGEYVDWWFINTAGIY
jgi:hypothetical protein